MYGSGAAGDPNGRDRRAGTLQHFSQQRCLRHPECESHPPPASHYIADKRRLLRTHLLEQHGLRIAIQTGRDIDQVGRRLDRLQLPFAPEQVHKSR